MNKNLILLVLLFVGLFLFGCNKDNSDSKKALLTSSSWKLVNYEKREVIGGVPSSWVSTMGMLDTCEKDNITFFESNGSFKESNGAIKCWVTSSDNYSTGSWLLLSDDTQVKVTKSYNGNSGNAYTYLYNISTLDKNTLQLSIIGNALSYPVNGAPANNDHEELRWTYTH
ncbi:MAG: hypothetical protein ICV66_01375 [Chitinophagaceae bacterium]|nr:hypothetical protein [Chitinophagaceae bacterium]